MRYEKPEVRLVRDAHTAIQSTLPKRSFDADSNMQISATAYEAAE